MIGEIRDRQITARLFGQHAIEWLAADHIEMPGLGVHRRRRTGGETNDLGDELAVYGFRLETADAAASEHDVIVIHGLFPIAFVQAFKPAI